MENQGTSVVTGQHVSLPDAATMLKLKTRLGVTKLFKSYLFEFEALIDEHDVAIAKLKSALPEQYKTYVALADYITDEKIELMRKRILYLGNELIRELDSTIDTLRI